MTKLESAIKRELTINKTAYVLTISPDSFNLALKGHRKGIQIAWRDLISGDAAMAVALNASLQLGTALTPKAKLAPKK